MHNKEGIWLSIADYSQYKKASVSTIRRHIKSNLIKHKEEDGKYFIYVPNAEKVKLKEDEELLRARLESELLRQEIKILREENSELRMLVDLYESTEKNTNQKSEPPAVPNYL